MSRGSVTFSDMSFSWGDGTPVFGGFGGSLISGRTGLVGPNGAGKSTLLRLVVGELRSWNGTTNPRKLTSSQVAGSIMSPNGLLIPFRLLTPTKGTIRVVGELGYLPQTLALDGERTAAHVLGIAEIVAAVGDGLELWQLLPLISPVIGF
ncbi:MAG: ATP-binding cassette domain-containing protein [Pseudonocardiaceae bacterium]